MVEDAALAVTEESTRLQQRSDLVADLTPGCLSWEGQRIPFIACTHLRVCRHPAILAAVCSRVRFAPSLRDRLRRPPAHWCGSRTATVTPGPRSTAPFMPDR